MLTVHPCVHACLPLPAGNPSDRKVACGSGDVDAPTQGVPVPAGFLVDPGEDLLLSGVPTEPTGWERRHSRAMSQVLSALGRRACGQLGTWE